MSNLKTAKPENCCGERSEMRNVGVLENPLHSEWHPLLVTDFGVNSFLGRLLAVISLLPKNMKRQKSKPKVAMEGKYKSFEGTVI